MIVAVPTTTNELKKTTERPPRPHGNFADLVVNVSKSYGHRRNGGALPSKEARNNRSEGNRTEEDRDRGKELHTQPHYDQKSSEQQVSICS